MGNYDRIGISMKAFASWKLMFYLLFFKVSNNLKGICNLSYISKETLRKTKFSTFTFDSRSTLDY